MKLITSSSAFVAFEASGQHCRRQCRKQDTTLFPRLGHIYRSFSEELYTTAAKVVNLEVAAGTTLPYDMLKEAVEKHKPAVLFLCQVTSHLELPPIYCDLDFL